MGVSEEKIFAYALDNASKHEGKAAQGAVLAGLFAEGLEKNEIKEYLPKVSKAISEVNKLSVQEQKDALEQYQGLISKREVREGLPPLPNADKGKVVVRFAPFPSGPLHIGNARTLILNDYYAQEYKGKLLLVIDDTIGSEKKPIEPDAYKLIEEGIRGLDIKFSGPTRKSDRMETYYEYAQKLIKMDVMYVCDCEREKIQKLKEEGVECSCRAYPVDVQEKRWKDMFKAAEGSMCVRLKTNMQDSDPAFRDRIMFRISDRPHALKGDKYRVYPLLDFSWAIDDHLFGVTHILRGTDLVMETRVEKFIWDILGWDHPKVVYNGHFEIEGVKISKSKGAAEVKSGTYMGWNDPRTWSLQSLNDRGILPESLKEFIVQLGVNKNNTKVPVDSLYAINRKNLNDVPRYFFVSNPIEISLLGAPSLNAKIPRHPSGTLGVKECLTSEKFLVSDTDHKSLKAGNYRFMHLLNFKVEETKEKNLAYSFISEEPNKELKCTFLHWLPSSEDNIPVKVRLPDNKIVEGLGEASLMELREGDIVQFERFGFVKFYKRFDDYLEFWFAHD